ncbi:hypothetical protein PIB30_069905 [Stylosanthes scabra]|uniref:Uncharacterized protein n=1 Tax=Stylosanthes scabra TaxID=79078 RepID=A0ABU6WLL8_9FABA|nr:hypothetical protein [Stylosanthes scabra]
MGSGVIFYEYEKREEFEDHDMRADAELGTFKIRRYHFDNESFAKFGVEVAGKSARNERIATKPRRLKLEPMRTHHWSHVYVSWPWAACLFGRMDTYAYASRASMRTHRSLPAFIKRGAFHHFKSAHFHI